MSDKTPYSGPDRFAPVTKEALIPGSLQVIFDRFTKDINLWWPFESHSMGRGNSESLTFPAHAGGRITESLKDGRRHIWGAVTLYEPPLRMIFSWHPGRPAQEATEIEVSFEAVGDAVKIRLVHRGWRILAAEPVNWRAEYDKGWDIVFHQCFVTYCRAAASAPDNNGPEKHA